ncbi:hypothetical protein DN401_23230 [Bacillus sp. BF2-3]|uniref:hypothetical protein n=1 Tax=Bacillus cereus group TaxID=86661 RepID=UPI0011EC76D3|nr:hypothetical protein [Bacillus sp. BF2-3]KAA0751538.1 hypothetical protein DN401_23230 [Bacillus sp. BF2-3]
MEKELIFPVPYSEFVRKKDAQYDGDPNGDYVMSEDVNELQESIEQIERVINFKELGSTVSDALNKKVDKAAISDFGSPLFVGYRGASINTYDSIEKRINAFSYIPHVMINKEESTNFNFFIDEVKKSGTLLYGIINYPNVVLNNIEADITWFESKGFHGVLLSNFGFENGWNRSQQNQILQYIHTKGMAAVITGEIETTLFNKPHKNNPQQEDLKTSKDDIYLAQDVFVLNGAKNNPIVIPSVVFNLNKAQKERGIQIFVEDTADASNDNNKLYLYGKMLSTLYNLDGYSLVPQSRYALNEKVERYLHGFELGKWKAQNPVYVEEATATSRSFSKGSLVFDKVKNECYIKGVGLNPSIYTWQDKQIPGSAIDFASAIYGSEGVETLVDAINDNNHLIHYSKIAGLTGSGATPDSIKDTVIRAINNSPAAVSKNGPGGYDAIAGNDFLHGGVIDYIDAGSIKSGVLNIEAIKTNIIEAINAYIGTAKINTAVIGELSAEHIAANVIDAINIYASNISAGQAKINNAVIGELSADKIKGAVIEAVNLYAGEAVIDSAKIGQLDADHIKAAVIEAINASIETAVIDSAKIGTLTASHIKGMVVEAINLYAGQAKIDAAQIGALKAENISAGLIEALEISAGSADFDRLQASVIEAINASIEHAFIDGAIIGEGTVDSAQIADGSITDAKIVSLTAAKIKAGTIDTSLVTLQGPGARLKITNNRLQVFDDQATPIERISLGDVNGDGSEFGFRVRGADGTTILLDHNGVREEGITDGAITNKKIENGAVDNDKVLQNSLQGDRLVVDAITAREIAAKSVNANHLQVGAIVAGSGVIEKGAIGEAEIAQASITDAHIKALSANKVTAGSIQMTSRNLVSNATFRKGTIDWILDSNFSTSEVSEIVRLNTTNSLHLFTTGKPLQNSSAYSKFVPASAGENYSASVYVLTKNLSAYDGGHPRVEVEYHNDSARITAKITTSILTGNDIWQRISVTETAPAGTTRVRLRIYHPKNGDSYFCRPMLQKGNIVTEWTGDGSFMTEDGFYTGELHAEQITTGRIKAGMVQIGPDTQFEPGYSPGELLQEIEKRTPYRVEIISTNGMFFKQGVVSTTLKAQVYKGSTDVTSQLQNNQFLWRRVDKDGIEDVTWNQTHAGLKEVPITRQDLKQRATFLCQIISN